MKNEIGIFKSIRTKLFLSLCIIVIAIIISLILLNNFVLRKFYEYNKEKQLENVYRGTDKTVYNNTVPLNITEDGKLKAIASCDNEINFYVDAETGKLYQKYIEDKNNNKVYAINDNDLIATDSSVEDSDWFLYGVFNVVKYYRYGQK